MQETKHKKSLWLPLGLFAVLMAVLLGVGLTHHLVWVDASPTLVRRVTPGLAEPISHLSDIKEQLWDDALKQYPHTVQALLRSGQLSCDARCNLAKNQAQLDDTLRNAQKQLALMQGLLASIIKEFKDECGIDIGGKGPVPKTAQQFKNTRKCCENLQALRQVLGASKMERTLKGAGHSPVTMAAISQCDKQKF
ncbi:MAG: hypothetical protein CVV27_07120 [Candidatus Melainabacteria bacterium HGW-Melainabacteria-1]|nr:MAG: hypothetical protein CVV27_07120 [Candidatus Melainabacteria bacterium HGW-Melainabacteria-1]